MSKKPVAPVVPAPDEHAGHGGSYVVDPGTGKRTLQERTAPAEQQPVKEQGNVDADA